MEQQPIGRRTYSAMRIETAKQKALTGSTFEPIKNAPGLIMDWTGDDEETLCLLLTEWDSSTGHAGLNRLIDYHRFSFGTHKSRGFNGTVPMC